MTKFPRYVFGIVVFVIEPNTSLSASHEYSYDVKNKEI